MESIKNFVGAIRNHWKKSVFFAGCVGFGVRYAVNNEKEKSCIRQYAEVAREFGHRRISPSVTPVRLTVLLNSLAANGKVSQRFERYALPLLHLAGFEVDIIKPKSVDQLVAIASAIDNTEADILMVVGGDGTISKAVSGLIEGNRERKGRPLPVAFFPGGLRNYSYRLNYDPGSQTDVKFYCESAMAVIYGAKSKLSALKIRTKKDAEESVSYGLGLLHWGQFQSVDEKKFKYWYWGKLRTKFAYVWHALWNKPENSRFLIEYSTPCSGCSKCRKAVQTARRWSLFSFFGLRGVPAESKIKCLNAFFGPKDINRRSFVAEGFRREREGFTNWLISDSLHSTEKILEAQKINLQPIVEEKENDSPTENQFVISVDGDTVECNFCEVEFLPDALETFIL